MIRGNIDRLIGDHGVNDPAVMEAIMVEYGAPIHRLARGGRGAGAFVSGWQSLCSPGSLWGYPGRQHDNVEGHIRAKRIPTNKEN